MFDKIAEDGVTVRVLEIEYVILKFIELIRVNVS